MKKCTHCKKDKRLEEFYKDSFGSEAAICKKCHNEKAKERHNKLREERNRFF